jgi:recombinational DNA repair protein (RecF pathway)
LGTIKTLLLAQSLPLEKVKRISFSSQALGESKQVLALFFQEYLRKDLKSQKFLDSLPPLGDPGKSFT